MNDPFQPRSYKDLVYPSAQVAQLVDDLVTSRLPFPAHGKNGLLIYGPNGTGKSTLARLLPDPIEMARTGQSAYPPTRHVIASGNNGASLMASLARTAETVALTFGHQFFILDEVDNLGEAAMGSLKSIMEHPMSIFIMTTNHLSAIERGVRSRSYLIDMTVPPPSEWFSRCRSILADLGVFAMPGDAQLAPIVAACGGDAREIVAQMHQLAALLRPAPP